MSWWPSEKISSSADSRIDAGVKDEGDATIAENAFFGRSLSIENASGSSILVSLDGEIYMPSGNVTVAAGSAGRIYLGPESLIDVSGYNPLKEATDKSYTVQLNSEQLRDEFLQKNGELLQETVSFLLHEGVSIGNISTNLDARTLTAEEYALTGGTVTLSAGTDGDVIMASGAAIDISGGTIHYNGGWVETTKLVASDGTVYDISDAPDYLTYTDVINPGDGNYPHLYRTYLNAHDEGYDAGTLTVTAGQAVFNGQLKADVTVGLFQVNRLNPVDDLGYETVIGTAAPKAGYIYIGEPSGRRLL